MFQRMAWFNLVVVALTAVAGVVLFFLAGAQMVPVAMAVLGLLGFSVSFGSRKKDRVLWDERDKEIGSKSRTASFFAFWFYISGVGTLVPVFFVSKDVPGYYWTVFIVGGLIIVIVAQSVALLILYRLGEEKTGGFLETGSKMTRTSLQQASWLCLFFEIFILSFFLYGFPAMGKSLPEKLFAWIVTVTTGSVFLVGFKKMVMDARSESLNHRARILSLIGMGATIAIGLCLLLSIYWLFGLNWFNFTMLAFVVFCGFASGILIRPVYILVQSLREPVDASE